MFLELRSNRRWSREAMDSLNRAQVFPRAGEMGG